MSVSAEPELPVITDLRQLLLSDAPLLDTRAPVEFALGAFPAATNLPLMDDDERRIVGKCYKDSGQEAAIKLGHELVSGVVKDQRLKSWQQFFTSNPQGALYCFRGGLRSRITQQWLYEQTGQAFPRVQGGYKALRRFALEQLEALPDHYEALVISGRTGSGKTRFLQHYQQQCDLEALANHRGSAFGPQVTPQPTQIAFENALAVDLLQKCERGYTQLLFEDESRNIGSVHLPSKLIEQLGQAKLIMLEVSDEERIAISYQEYVVDMVAAFTQQSGNTEAGFTAFSDYILGSLTKIRRRLGGVRYAEVQNMMRRALKLQRESGDTLAHQDWVRYILLDYYDPMYDYQISKKQSRLIFRGDRTAITDYLAELDIR
ncbi:MAG: tRNA 2-selenouridine(34) synthase MnmH [Thiolinea sp.]